MIAVMAFSRQVTPLGWHSLLELEIGMLDDIAPALHVGIVDRLHLLRRAWFAHEAELNKALGDIGLGEHFRDLGIEAHDNSFRRACRSHEAVPGGDLIAGDTTFGDRWYIRQQGTALVGRQRERA